MKTHRHVLKWPNRSTRSSQVNTSQRFVFDYEETGTENSIALPTPAIISTILAKPSFRRVSFSILSWVEDGHRQLQMCSGGSRQGSNEGQLQRGNA